MADVTVKRTEEFEPTFRGGMLKARAGLGVNAFGMQVLRLPAGFDRYPEHDHTAGGQEEVYTVLEGSATLVVGDERYELQPGMFARIGPNERRKLVTTGDGALVLALGGVPGQAFEATGFTNEGESDPLADRG